MSWQDLLQVEGEKITLPWVGGRTLHSNDRTWRLERVPPEPGWYTFELSGRTAVPLALEEFDAWDDTIVEEDPVGFLVGDRFVRDGVVVDPNPARIAEQTERVHLIPEGLDRFARVRVGRVHEEGPLIFWAMEFPLGPEDEVRNLLLDGVESVSEIANVTPGLDAAFRMEVFRRKEVERRRREAEERRRREAEERARAERRAQLRERLGDGEARRELAQMDFEAAARAALAVAGARYLDHRKVGRRGEYAVKYQVDDRRLECTCDATLHIIDAGVCLQDHDTGVKGDTRFTLESLPSVIREAIADDKLVVWRHV